MESIGLPKPELTREGRGSSASLGMTMFRRRANREGAALERYAGRELRVLARPGILRSQERRRNRLQFQLGPFVRTRHAVAPFSERAIHRVAAVQEREHRRAAHADTLEGAGTRFPRQFM